MRPGGMQFTVMPCLPTMRDRPLAQLCMPALAQNAPLMCSGSLLPVMLMMRPHWRAIIWSINASPSWRGRWKFSVIASCHCSSLTCRSLNERDPPALFTRMSTWPSPAMAAAARFREASSAYMSCVIRTGRAPPVASISAASSSSFSARRAVMASFTPSAASARAMPRPMPTLAPVTSAVLFLSCRSMVSPRCADCVRQL